MSQRKARIRKVQELRQRTLDQRLAALAQARRDQEACSVAAQASAKKLEAARESRAALLGGAVGPRDWELAEDWIYACQYDHALKLRDLSQAKQRVQQAASAVSDAQTDLKRLELVVARIALEEQKQATRLDQKRSDEHAARSFDAQKRRVGS